MTKVKDILDKLSDGNVTKWHSHAKWRKEHRDFHRLYQNDNIKFLDMEKECVLLKDEITRIVDRIDRAMELQFLIDQSGKSLSEVCEILGVSIYELNLEYLDCKKDIPNEFFEKLKKK